MASRPLAFDLKAGVRSGRGPMVMLGLARMVPEAGSSSGLAFQLPVGRIYENLGRRGGSAGDTRRRVTR